MPGRVTRLIKASKSPQKPARDTSSLLGGSSSPSGSSLNITKPEVQVGQKLSVAQAELQACEAHLAAKEQELGAFRTRTIRAGLEARCKAMVECGWAWGEMGKEGMRALEGLGTVNGYGASRFRFYVFIRFSTVPGVRVCRDGVAAPLCMLSAWSRRGRQRRALRTIGE